MFLLQKKVSILEASGALLFRVRCLQVAATEGMTNTQLLAILLERGMIVRLGTSSNVLI